VHEFRACHRGVEVEILQIDCVLACTLCGDDAVEMNFDHDHVNGGGTTILRISDGIAANGKVSLIGIGFFRAIVDTRASVRDVCALVDRDIVASDEDNCVGAIADAGDALGKATGFDCVGLAPEFFVLGVDKNVAHFDEGTGVGFEDGIENFPWELPMRSLVRLEWAAGDVVVNMDVC
jgi:hypothetical protein